MNNTDWKILIYLREERSINKVAKRLFMTQPSLTYRLSQMEKEIGCPLFIRTNKGVHFTDAGARLFSFAEKELQQYQDMKNYVTHEPNSISGVLRIGASQSFSQSHGPALLKGFVDEYSDIEISLTTDTSDRLVKLVKKEDIHLAIVRGNQEWPESDILLEDASVALAGVTINGSSQISRPDRKLVFPSERQMKVATNGVNLLQELMLPRIQVNPMNNEIGISGGGELQIRINGAKADINEIKALRPVDIIRIEYHDNPGLRYGNAEIVLDYIVRRPDTGGSFGTDLSQGINAMWGNYNVFGKVNHKKSEFGLSYYMGPRDFYGMYRDNEETFRLADGNTIQRVEKGEPSHAMLFMQNLNVSYSLQASKNSLFSATFRLRGNNQPNWDYQGVLYNVNDATDMVNMIDRTKNSWTRPSLDLYYQQNLKNKQTLVFNLVGTYNREKSHRIYQESLHNEMLTDINNDVSGDKYSLIGEAIYEKQFSKGNALSFGLQHTQSYSNNAYRNGHNYDTRMNQGNSYIFSEYRGKIHKLDYRLGISLTRFYYNQSGNDKPSEKYNVNPKATLHYTFSENS